MSSRMTKALLTIAVGIVAFVGFSSSAVASRAIGTPGLLVTFTGPATLTVGFSTIVCNLRLGVSTRTSIAKTTGAIVGTIGTALSAIENCNGGITGTLLNAIDITYRTFTGTLPLITGGTGTTTAAGFRLVGGIFGAAGCLYSAAAGALSVNLIGTGGTIRTANFSGSTTSSGVAPCSTPATLRSGTLTAALTIALTLA